MIYFDNAATTIPYGEALKTYQEVATKIYGNPSSLHQLGTNASRILEASVNRLLVCWVLSQKKSFYVWWD